MNANGSGYDMLSAKIVDDSYIDNKLFDDAVDVHEGDKETEVETIGDNDTVNLEIQTNHLKTHL